MSLLSTVQGAQEFDLSEAHYCPLHYYLYASILLCYTTLFFDRGRLGLAWSSSNERVRVRVTVDEEDDDEDTAGNEKAMLLLACLLVLYCGGNSAKTAGVVVGRVV